MSGVEAAFLIATFHVAGARVPEAGESLARQARAPVAPSSFPRSSDAVGPPAPPTPMSLTLALLPARTEGTMPDRLSSSSPQQRDTSVTIAGAEAVHTAAEVALPMDAIRMEIRRRLVLFQWCAEAAKRRGVADVRRLSVTWSIAPDGRIQAMKLEGVMDPEMAACLARVGSRRFPIEPGTELTIPVPIVFVR